MENKIQQFREAYLQLSKVFKNISTIEVYMSKKDMLDFYNEWLKEITEMGLEPDKEYIPGEDLTLIMNKDFVSVFKIKHNGE